MRGQTKNHLKRSFFSQRKFGGVQKRPIIMRSLVAVHPIDDSTWLEWCAIERAHALG
jgi:hypothetical protein